MTSRPAPIISTDAFRELLELIEDLKARPVLSREDCKRLGAEHRKRALDQMLSGASWGETHNAPTILQQNEDDFRAELRRIANDLGEQVAITKEIVENRWSIGEPLFPYYPRRIAIILRKAKLHKAECNFLAAMHIHFPWFESDRLEKAMKLALKTIPPA